MEILELHLGLGSIRFTSSRNTWIHSGVIKTGPMDNKIPRSVEKGDQITSAKREWFICLQLTDKQWIITQQFTARADLFLKWNSIQLFHACLGNSQNCCPEVPWTARCSIARGWKAKGNGTSSCPRYRGFVYTAKQPWNNCFITQPMLKISVLSQRNACLIGTRRRYTQLSSWRWTSFSWCLTSSTRQ